MRHLARAALLTIVLIAAALLGGCGSRPDGGGPLASGVLRVGTEGTYAPFSFQDPATGQLAGYDVDVANAVGQKLGKKRSSSSKRHGIRSSPRSKPTGSTWWPTKSPSPPERQSKYDLSEPYSVGEGVIITRSNDDSIKSLNDLRGGKTVGASITSNWAQVSRDAGGATVAPVEGFTQAITLLSQGRVDAVVNDSIAFHAYAAETNNQSVKISATIGEKKSEQGVCGSEEQRPAAGPE